MSHAEQHQQNPLQSSSERILKSTDKEEQLLIDLVPKEASVVELETIQPTEDHIKPSILSELAPIQPNNHEQLSSNPTPVEPSGDEINSTSNVEVSPLVNYQLPNEKSSQPGNKEPSERYTESKTDSSNPAEDHQEAVKNLNSSGGDVATIQPPSPELVAPDPHVLDTISRIIESVESKTLPDLPKTDSSASQAYSITPTPTTTSATTSKLNDVVTNHSPTPQASSRVVNEKKKEDDKLAIYKALAIKLKKELVKCRDELHKLKENSQRESAELKEKVEVLEDNLNSERHKSANTITTLEAKNRILKERLDTSEADLQNLQEDFENYKIQATRIMQQNSLVQSSSTRTFEEERYKQLKEFNEEQKKYVKQLEAQLVTISLKNQEIDKEAKSYQEELKSVQEKVGSIKMLDNKCETLTRENENLKIALKQFRSKLKEPSIANNLLQYCDEAKQLEVEVAVTTSDTEVMKNNKKTKSNNSNIPLATDTTSKVNYDNADSSEGARVLDGERNEELTRTQHSPSASLKDDSQTNSSSSIDGSSSGYVHIKPAPFEIISRSSVLEDAQNQIDNLTKAYLDSENTNSLLSEQVKALKEEIRRLQRGTDRLDLAENLEYLKNVVFKFLALDNGQFEQKQQLIPVLSTVLKLSPSETARLNSLARVEKQSMASSFFKL